MSTKPAYLVLWMLLHVSADPSLTTQIRDEIKPYARAIQPPRTFTLAEPPRLEINADGLVKSCPLLKACFCECLRLHSTSTSVRSVAKTVEVQSSPNQAYILEAGKIVAAPMSLHHYDPDVFQSPNVFQPSRFLSRNKHTGKHEASSANKLKPWGIGTFACPGRDVAEKQVLALIAGLLAMWEFGPVNPRGWVIPGQEERAVVAVPSEEIRVRVRARHLQS